MSPYIFMDHIDVSSETTLKSKPLFAFATLMWFFASMSQSMRNQIIQRTTFEIADVTAMDFLHILDMGPIYVIFQKKLRLVGLSADLKKRKIIHFPKKKSQFTYLADNQRFLFFLLRFVHVHPVFV